MESAPSQGDGMLGYRSRYSLRFTAPQPLTFGISAVLTVLALLVTYTEVSIPLISGNAFLTLLIAWIVLVCGVLMPGM